MAEQGIARARSAAEFGELMGSLFDRERVGQAVAAYRPLPTDVVISPYGKCGTTWLQQAFHTLRTGGDTDYDDISRVVPWIETALVLGIDINAPQRAGPRGFKSHLGYDALPRGARYVVCLRDPKDALVSMHKFMEGWFIEPGAVPIGDFARGWTMGGPEGRGYWEHLASWWRERDNPDVLLLSFAQMLDDPAGHIRTFAGFCGITLDDALLALTLERSSIAYMLANKHQFDDAMLRTLSEERLGLPPGSDSAKVREGKVGSHRTALPPEVGDMIDAQWQRRVPVELGIPDFAAVEMALAERMALRGFGGS